MPYVNIRVAGKLSRKQKDKIVKGVTKVIAKEAEKPTIKVSLFEGQFYGPEKMDVIKKLPSRDVLLGKIVGGLNSPIQGLVGSLNGLLQKLVLTLDAVKTSKE